MMGRLPWVSDLRRGGVSRPNHDEDGSFMHALRLGIGSSPERHDAPCKHLHVGDWGKEWWGEKENNVR